MSSAKAHKHARGETIGLTSLLFLETAAAHAWVVVAALALADRRVMRRVHRRERAEQGASITMIVPARNESANIVAWLRDARAQTQRPELIIIADDCSEDDTAQVALEASDGDERVRVLTLGPPPAGWVGKPWAAYNAALHAQSEWLHFSDADMRMRPEALASALHEAVAVGADALSLSATLECRTLSERLIMPAVAALIFSALPASLVNDDRFPVALLAGGFMLVRREAYVRIGGHFAVRGSIAEDRDIAERFKAFGYRVRLFDGSKLSRVRMYQGLSQMWGGWRKNFYDGARRTPWLAAVSVLMSLGMLVLPLPTLVTLGIRGMRRPLARSHRRLAWACGASVAATVLVRLVRDRAIGFRTDAVSLLATPVAGVFTAAVMCASAWRIISGRGQRWKGRTIH